MADVVLAAGRAGMRRQRIHTDGLSLPQCADVWMKDKAERDQALSGCPPHLWLIHGRLYDLAPFVSTHPGGPDWLQWTKGTDCTTEFETHHLDASKAEAVLRAYDRGPLESPNPSAAAAYTWADTGFYRTVKRAAFEVLKARGPGPSLEMRLLSGGAVVLWTASVAAVGLAPSGLGAIAAAICAGYMTCA